MSKDLLAALKNGAGSVGVKGGTGGLGGTGPSSPGNPVPDAFASENSTVPTPTDSPFTQLTLSLDRLDGAFGALARAVDGATSRLAALAREGVGAGTAGAAGAAGLTTASGTALALDLGPGQALGLGPGQALADAERIVDLAEAQVAARSEELDLSQEIVAGAGQLVEVQDAAARQVGGVWDGFAGDLAGSFKSLFGRVARDGELELGDLWDTVGKQFVGAFAKLDLGPVVGPLMGQFSGIVDAVISGNTGGLIQGLASAFGGMFSGDGLGSLIGGIGSLFTGGDGAALGGGGGGGGFFDGIGGSIARNVIGKAVSSFLPDIGLGSLGNLGSIASNVFGALGAPGAGLSTISLAAEAGASGQLLTALSGPEIFSGFGGAASSAAGAGTGALASIGTVALPLAAAAIAAFVLPKLFGGKQNPASSATFGLEEGRLGEVGIHINDGGDPEMARAIGEAVKGVMNPFLDALGVDLLDGAFRGQVGYVEGEFRSATQHAALSDKGPVSADMLGIHGVDSDLRSFGDNQVAATADFITRSLLEAISSGNMSQVTEEMSNTMVHGLRNLAASINEDYDEEAFKALPRQLEFLRTFDRQVRLYRNGAEALHDYNEQLAMQREEIEKTAKAEAKGVLQPIRDFLQDAHDLLGAIPAEGTGGGIIGGMETAGDFTIIARDFADEAPFRFGGGVTGLWDAGRNIEGDIDMGARFSVERHGDTAVELGRVESGARSLGSGFEIAGVQFLMGELGGFEGGTSNRVKVANTGQELELATEVGTYDATNLGIKTDVLLEALRAAGADMAEAIEEVFGEEVASRIGDAADAARGMVTATIDGLALEEGPEAPLTGLALTFETQRAKIEALRPELEKLNEDLVAFGQTAIDVDAVIRDGQDTLLENVQEDFRQSLGDQLDPNAARQGALEEQKAGRITEAQQIGLGEDDGVMGMIDRLYADGLSALGMSLDESGTVVQRFTKEMKAAAGAAEEQIRSQEAVASAAQATIDSLTSAKQSISLDPSLGLMTPMEQLAERKNEFESVAATAISQAASDEDRETAQRELGQVSREYLEIAREVYASSDDYVAIFQNVDRVLDQALSQAELQLTNAEKQLTVLEQIRDSLGGSEPSDGNYPIRAKILRALTGFDQDFGGGRYQAFLHSGRFGQDIIDKANEIATTINFAGGGVMTSLGELPLERYARGGIARRPQVALFGEGRQPEAFVPLPDGRSIPVTMKTGAVNDDMASEQREANRLARTGTRDLITELRRLRSDVSGLHDHNNQLERMLSRLLAGRATAGRAA